MGILLKKQRKELMFSGIGKLAIIGLIVSLAAAFVDTIWAIYLDSFLNSLVAVGFISAALTIVSFTSYFIFIPFIEKSKKSKIYSYSLLFFAITYLLFAINKKFYIFVILAFILTILATLKTTSFGIIVKNKSNEKQLVKNEGLMYTFSNISWVLGPLIAGYISKKFGINLIFLISAIFIIIAFLVFKISGIRDAHIKKRVHKSVVKNFLEFFRSKQRILAYILGGGVNLWWILIYLFMPIYIIRNGLDTLWLGYFLFAIAFPLIVLEYKFSKLTGKIGFKKIFQMGYIIPSIAAFTCFFITNTYIILGILVLASIGLAMLEPTTEAYFFDISKEKDDCRFYGPYNTTIDVNAILGKILASILLIFMPFKYLFILFGSFMFILFLISSKMKNIIETRRDGKKNK